MNVNDIMDMSRQAIDKLATIAGHVQALGHDFGTDSPEYQEAATTWIHCQASIWRLLRINENGEGGGRLYAEGDLSMGLTTSYGLQVGIVFFRDRAYDGAMVNPDGKPHIYDWWAQRYHYCLMHRSPIANEECRGKGESEEPCLRHTVSLPGTWSTHS
jgi:hypothetical protein